MATRLALSLTLTLAACAGTYFAPYSGPQIVRISGLKPNTSYVLDVEFLSSTRTALTIVRP